MELQHRGYSGSAAEEDGRIVVSIVGISDMISADASDAGAVREVFRDLVEDYLATCAELGKPPDPPAGALSSPESGPT